MAEHFIALKQKAEEKKKKLKERSAQLSTMRFISFCAAVVLLIIGCTDHREWLQIAGIVCAVLFLVLVYRFQKVQEQLQEQLAMCEVLRRYIARFSDDWKEFEEMGQEYLKEIPDSEKEAYDLDIFGKASLFQYMNTAVSKNGKDRLAKILCSHLGAESNSETVDFKQLKKRQEAVKELLEKEALALKLETVCAAQKQLHQKELYYQDIGKQEPPEAKKEKKQAIVIAAIAGGLLAMTVCSILATVFGGWPATYTAGLLVIQFVLSQFWDGMLFQKSYETFSYVRYLTAYEPFLTQFGQEEYESALLQEMEAEIGHSFSEGTSRLKMVKECLLVRHNPIVYGLLCGMVLYNAFVYLAFVGWKQRYEASVADWLKVSSRLEVLLSLAVIGRTRKNQTFPVLEETESPQVRMEQMQHPLIQEKNVVVNDCVLQQEMRVITGSNMSGKTTYLRTMGVNVVLAYAGAPVCASQCRLSWMRVFTSMRVVDDVSHGISTFYAEVLRIRKMTMYAKKQQPMLVLIDEIFKGTNSADRIIGATAVIKELCHSWINGMVSTHDFELCQLAQTYPQIANYHFNEYFEEDELKFDYKVKEGRCTTTNALHILKMAGITIEGKEEK